MTASQNTTPPPYPRARLRELLVDSTNSPEIAALRLDVLRLDAPKTAVQIDSVRADDIAIAVKVTIGLPGGARNSSIVAIDVDPDRSWAEQHDETQATAIAKVLDGLGIRSEQAPRSTAPAATDQRQQPTESPVKPATAQRAEDDHLPEYSWTSFWQAAHARNITREQVEQALGRSVQQASPKDAMDALQSKGMWE